MDRAPEVSSPAAPNGSTAEGLWSEAYPELRRIARRRLRRETRRVTYDTQELVQETYRRLAAQRTRWLDDSHLCGVASMTMARILIDRARQRVRQKRDDILSPPPEASWAGLSGSAGEAGEELLALKRAVDRLRETDERQALVVELRFLAGLTTEEVAEVLEISRRTVDRDWIHARCWLRRELARSEA
ncbi:MAG: ECF-type sigma factor [Myxococcota bacterium]|nr:ECF-type sigma factor [Myxococcota bacterium]